MRTNETAGTAGTMMEFRVDTDRKPSNPFWDCTVTAAFRRADGACGMSCEGFYDGEDERGRHVWKVRWTPPSPGLWRCEIISSPRMEETELAFAIDVRQPAEDTRGFLRAVPGGNWNFYFDNGEPCFLLGDTIYNLFGGHYCGVDVDAILDRRREQGVNYVRARAQVSASHADSRGAWQTKSCWPWGRSPQWPDFTRFNLAYFRSVDEAMEKLAARGMGVELILEAWMLEFPFNDRSRFLPEHEELWMRYLIARYAAYPSLYVWCPANEYEFYPGSAAYHSVADRWFRRLAKLIKAYDPYRHPVGAHQWHQKLALHERLGDCEELDVYLVQSDWMKEYDVYARDPSLCLWIDEQVRFHAPDKAKAAMCSEFGYEKADDSFTLDAHELFDHHHTRRGQWRTGFSGFPVVHGFNNTWGPHLTVARDAIGTAYLPIFRTFMTEDVPFEEMARETGLWKQASGDDGEGTAPLAMANADRSAVAIYFPRAGNCELDIGAEPSGYAHYWLNPRTGERTAPVACGSFVFRTPDEDAGADGLGDDWVLCVKAAVR